MDKEKNSNKKSKNNNLILIKSIIEANEKKSELTDREKELQKRLLEIDDKLKSIEKVISTVNDKDPNTIFASEAFEMLIESIAITASIEIIANYFEISIDDIDNILK